MGKKLTICPYCKKPASKVHSSVIYGGGTAYGWMYSCTPCDAYVGCHKGTDKPLGSLANSELREQRKFTHLVFDYLWQVAGYARNNCYLALARCLHVKRRNAHFGHMDLRTLDSVLMLMDYGIIEDFLEKERTKEFQRQIIQNAKVDSANYRAIDRVLRSKNNPVNVPIIDFDPHDELHPFDFGDN